MIVNIRGEFIRLGAYAWDYLKFRDAIEDRCEDFKEYTQIMISMEPIGIFYFKRNLCVLAPYDAPDSICIHTRTYGSFKFEHNQSTDSEYLVEILKDTRKLPTSYRRFIRKAIMRSFRITYKIRRFWRLPLI